MAHERELELWDAYHAEPCTAHRNRLAEHYLHLVHVKASVMAPALRSDLVGYGVLGLLRAIERFDPQRGVQFPTYADAWVRGAILSGLGELGPGSRKAGERMAKTERDLTTTEAARLLRCSLRTVARACEDGTIPSYRVLGSGHRRIRVADLLRVMRELGLPLPDVNGEAD